MIIHRINEDKLNQIILACQKNDGNAQEELYHLYSAKFFGICLRYASDYPEAEDMLQEGFVKLYQNIQKYNFTGSFPAWSSRLFSNNCIDQLRKKSNLYAISEEKAYTLEAATLQAIDSLYLEDLVNLIQELPIGYRTVFNLFVVDGYSHKEIAEKLEINEGTSKSQLNRARQLLQKKIIELNAIELSKIIKA